MDSVTSLRGSASQPASQSPRLEAKPSPEEKNNFVSLAIDVFSTRFGDRFGDIGGGFLLGYQRSVSLAPRHRLALGGGASYGILPLESFQMHGHLASPEELQAPSDARPNFHSEMGAHALVDYRYAWVPSFLEVGAFLDIAGLWANGAMPYPDNSTVHAARGAVQFGPVVQEYLLPWLSFSMAAGLRVDSKTIGREDSPVGLLARAAVSASF